MKQLSEITRNVVLFCLLVAAMACPVTLSAQTQGTGNRVFHVNQIPLKLVFVKGGDMQMGCSDERDGDCMSQEVPTHTVTLTDFYIGETEITQAQWMAVMGRDNNPSYWKGNTLPVERVSWEECHRFIARLNKYLSAELPEGYRFALPSEAQWEYAARGGHRASPSATAYAGSDNIDIVAWYWNNSPQYQTENPVTHEPMLIRHTSEVRGKQPNELNIYDMTGNVREWCADWYSPLGTAAVTDPEGLSSAGYGRVYRGGSCNDSAQYCRVAHREGLSSSSKSYNIGFRVVITMD